MSGSGTGTTLADTVSGFVSGSNTGSGKTLVDCC